MPGQGRHCRGASGPGNANANNRGADWECAIAAIRKGFCRPGVMNHSTD